MDDAAPSRLEQQPPGGRSGTRSAFAGSRQPSEESRNLRFNPNIAEVNRAAGGGKPADWKNRVRRISRVPHTGLTRIRVGGHLNYKEIRSRFERQSTFHGISHAALAPTKKWRRFWHIVFSICLFALILQVFFLVVKYRSYPKTVDLDLKFENAPFPSITLCNLNPYKKSMIYNNPSTKETMDAFSNLQTRGTQGEGVAAILAAKLNTRARRESRKKRRKDPRRYHQVFAQCLCDVDPRSGLRNKGSCLSVQKGKVSLDVANAFGAAPINLQPSKCLCQMDSVSHTLWPCFPYGSWKEKLCSECVDDNGHCPMRFYKGDEPYENIKDIVDICLCHKEYNHCVANNDDGVIPFIDPDEDVANINITQKANQMRTQQAPTTTTQAPEVVEAMGYNEVTDEIAIATVGKQNLIYAVGSMDDTEKVQLSHKMDEFILKCSFNQKDCDIQNDFKLHYDQTYGNCFTFNWNRSSAVTAHRAGANYGLRVMLYADVSEYLPTSDIVGFRITVHDKWIVPFPDAFGYNAPTGFLSSFGVRMKKFLRIMQPHGHCKNGGEESPDFVYSGFNYSVEACHRSCTQKKIIELCGCADPMYPTPRDVEVENCKVTDKPARDCIWNTTITLGVQIAEGKVQDCSCHQPCTETNYEVTYSAARWPSGAAKVAECTAVDYMCMEKYRKNAAMIQIFYEELNYETMIETEAYSFSSFMADFGGVTGLWIGASVVSMVEIFTLIVFAVQTYVRKKKEESGGSRKNSSNMKQDVRMSLSTHSSKSKASLLSIKSSHKSHKSMESMLNPPIVEDDATSEGSSDRTQGSCRYLAPGEELPCLCKYNEIGHIVVMKALCPVHGYMVRRNYDYSVSNSEEEEPEGVDEVHKEEPYYKEPFRKISRMSKKGRKKKEGENEGGGEEGGETKEGEGGGEEGGGSPQDSPPPDTDPSPV